MEDNNQKTIEERFSTIENILSRLERNDVTLDESFELYKNGMTELQKANAMIEQTRKAVMAISSKGNLEPFEDTLEPFEETDADA